MLPQMCETQIELGPGNSVWRCEWSQAKSGGLRRTPCLRSRLHEIHTGDCTPSPFLNCTAQTVNAVQTLPKRDKNYATRPDSLFSGRGVYGGEKPCFIQHPLIYSYAMAPLQWDPKISTIRTYRVGHPGGGGGASVHRRIIDQKCE